MHASSVIENPTGTNERPVAENADKELMANIPPRERTRVKLAYSIQLGKMLQNQPESPNDTLRPYLKAGHVRAGSVNTSDLPEMWFSTSDLKQYEVRYGDLLVSEGGDVGRCALWSSPNPVHIQNSVLRVRERGGNSTAFLRYWLEYLKAAGYIDMVCNRATIAHYTQDKLGDSPIGLPPAQDQKRMVSFLDRETARIDTLIAKKEHLLDLLEEKRMTVVSQAVTKGLNPSSVWRDSGIPTIGMIPTLWSVCRNKALFHVVNEPSVKGNEELLTVSHITGVTRRSEKNVYMFLAESNEGYKRCKAGDLIINTMWAWMGAAGVAKQSGIVSPAYGVYRPNERIYPPFMDLLIRTPEYRSEMARFSQGVWRSRLRLYPEAFLSLKTPLPPMKDQVSICKWVEQTNAASNRLSDKLELSITLLLERRQSLIRATVTGQLDPSTYMPKEGATA